MTNKPDNQDELLNLGKKLQQFYNMGYVSKKKALLFTFYRGLAYGAGIFIGGTVVIALVIWILSLFTHVPLAGHFINQLRVDLHRPIKND